MFFSYRMFRRNGTQSSPESSPRKTYGEGISFFNHFHKAFVCPYGKAKNTPDAETIVNRINSHRCEWLCHPQGAISELSDSLRTNMPIIEALPLINGGELDRVLKTIAKLTSAMVPFERNSTTVPAEDDTTELIELSLDQHSLLDEFWSSAFELGGALITSSLNYSVVRELLRNPRSYADKLTASVKHAKFKSSANLADNRDIWIQGQQHRLNRLLTLLAPLHSWSHNFDLYHYRQTLQQHLHHQAQPKRGPLLILILRT